MFLVAGRVELFNENFADPAAAVLDPDGSWGVASLGRLWTFTFTFNLLGGCLFALVFAVVGVLLALGPFDHIVVTALHVYVGVLFGARVTPGALLVLVVTVTAGNVVGGLGLVTLTHVFQVKGARMS